MRCDGEGFGVRTATFAEVTLEGMRKGLMHYIAAWKYVSLFPVRAIVQCEGEQAHVNQPKDEKSIHMYRHRHRVPSVLAWNVLVITRRGGERS